MASDKDYDAEGCLSWEEIIITAFIKFTWER